jgi:hypothetical protein
VDKIVHDLGIPLPADRTQLIKETKVRMCPLSKLMDERFIEEEHALFIEVEGNEHHFLKSFPLEEHRPGLIVYDQIHLTLEAASACRDLLSSYSCALISDGMGAIAAVSDTLE